jgi:RNA polymerase sigma factor (sigma-70 family)
MHSESLQKTRTKLKFCKGLVSFCVSVSNRWVGQLMRNDSTDPLPTRATLLMRLKSWSDDASWQEFFDTYWRLIYSVALKSGLSESDAQDVVQETLLSVAKKIDEFRADRSLGSFKGWLLNVTRWRILDHLRRQNKHPISVEADDGHTGTAAIDRVPDPAALPLEEVWEQEWQSNLLAVAQERVQRRVNPRHWQIFDLHGLRGWSAPRTARHLGVSIALVYVVGHRVQRLLRDTVRRLERARQLPW